MANKRISELTNEVTVPTDGAYVALDVPAPGESERILVTNLIPPAPPVELPPTGNFLKSGGVFAHDGGLDIAVGVAEYYIQGLPYSSPAAVVTADAADATHPRIDAIVLNSSGVAAIVTGTPAASPVRPVIDPSTQLGLTFITVAALATEPEIDVEPIYLENTEWTITPSAGTIDPDDTTGERSGTKAIKFTAAAAGANFKAVDGAPYNVAGKSQLTFWVNPVTWVSQKQLQIQCYLSNVAVGNIVTLRSGVFGFDRTVASYQLVAIPTSYFGLGTTEPDEIRWTIAGGSTALTCFIDDIALQGGLVPVASKAMLNPMTTAGDLIIGGTDGAPERLAAGTSGHVLTSNGAGTAPSYQAPSASGGGTKTLASWAAHQGQPPATNYATFNTRNARAVMEFDDSTSESLLYYFKIPEGADLSAGIRVITEWKGKTATSGNIGTTTSFERGNTDSDSDSFATGVDSAAVAINGTSGISVFVTTDHDETEIDGLAVGESGYLKVARNVGITGDLTGDAQLIGVEIQQLA